MQSGNDLCAGLTYQEELEILGRTAAPRIEWTGRECHTIPTAIVALLVERQDGERQAADYSEHELTFVVLCNGEQREQAAKIAQRYMEPKPRYASREEVAATLTRIDAVARTEQSIIVNIRETLAQAAGYEPVETVRNKILASVHHTKQARKQARQ